MKITCNEIKAGNYPPNVVATLTDVQKVQAETPDEIKVIVETVGYGQLLEEIGIDKVKKHFGLGPFKALIKNQLNEGKTIDFCLGEREFSLKYEEEVEVEIDDDFCLYLDIVK